MANGGKTTDRAGGLGRPLVAAARAVLAGAVLAASVAAPALAAGPTRIERVDPFIDAPLALFGRTRDGVERRLGAPPTVDTRTVGAADSAGAVTIQELRYPGLVIETHGADRVRRVQVTTPAVQLPEGLGVGSPRSRVEEVLGEPQQASDTLALYLYSDGYPDTVTFHFRDDRVHRVEWRYWVAP